MRHIDAFCHFFPSSIFRLMSETAGGTTDVGKRMQGVRTIHDLDARFRMMDQFDDYTQILSLGTAAARRHGRPRQDARSLRASPTTAWPSWWRNIRTGSPATSERCR